LQMDVDALDAKTLDIINSLSVQEMSTLLGKEAQEDIEMAASKRAQTSHWDDQSEEMFQEINTQSQMWMKMMGVRHYMHYTSRTRWHDFQIPSPGAPPLLSFSRCLIHWRRRRHTVFWIMLWSSSSSSSSLSLTGHRLHFTRFLSWQERRVGDGGVPAGAGKSRQGGRRRHGGRL
jgi:hypothetical protein